MWVLGMPLARSQDRSVGEEGVHPPTFNRFPGRGGGTQQRQQTGGGATQTHRTRGLHQEGQGRAQKTRRRGTARQERQPERREQGTRMEGMGERANGRQRQQRGWLGQPAPSLPGARATPAQPASGGECLPQPRWAVCATGAGARQGQTSREGEKTYGGRPGQRVEEQGTWASHTQNQSEASYGWPVDRGAWTAKTVKRPRQQPAQPPIRQLLGAADAQTAHHATFSTAPTLKLLGSANAETTPARAPAAAADRTQRPDATLRREERVTVQGPVKEQQPDGMSHRGVERGKESPSVARARAGATTEELEEEADG